MLHKEFFGFIFLAFVAWVFMAASPSHRIENFCRPVGWIGNGTVSLSSLVIPSQQVRVQGWFDKVEYGCRFVTWRLVYQETYNQWPATQGLTPEEAAAAGAAALGPLSPPEAATQPDSAASAPAAQAESEASQ